MGVCWCLCVRVHVSVFARVCAEVCTRVNLYSTSCAIEATTVWKKAAGQLCACASIQARAFLAGFLLAPRLELRAAASHHPFHLAQTPFHMAQIPFDRAYSLAVASDRTTPHWSNHRPPNPPPPPWRVFLTWRWRRGLFRQTALEWCQTRPNDGQHTAKCSWTSGCLSAR